MASQIVSDYHYQWFLSLITGVVAAYWIAIDSYRLRKWLRADKRDLANRDRIVGSILGIVIGVVGVIGVWMHLSKHWPS